MLGPRHEIASLQSVFYRDQYHRMLRWLIASIAIIYVLLAIMIYILWTLPEPMYYANTTDGKILLMPHQL
ncbi:MAG: hypothetical protein A3E85_02080 [Gammaproteobacteria bacterium RIFCSPHIGHO2_12_FULL_45_12]|nr:MAG: hypothetical protein A3E85_02080 [Gammaproteobacteria bacterium RIFCSPHIGHO2_12_FULL_45_12]